MRSRQTNHQFTVTIIARLTLVLAGFIVSSQILTMSMPHVEAAEIASPSVSSSSKTDVYTSTLFLPIIEQDCCVYHAFLPVLVNNYDPTPSFFSIQMYNNLNDSNGFGQLPSMGARWVRFPVAWAQIEPSHTIPANYQWNNLDASLATATTNDVNVIATVDFNPSWAAIDAHGPVTNINNLTEFVGAVVARYPQVKYWEFYNEPDNIFGGFGDKGKQYAAMLNAVYPYVKAANPAAQVVLGGIASDWFSSGLFDQNFLPDVLNNCAKPCFDIANFHYYPVFRSNWEKYGPDIIGKANYVRQTIKAYGFNRPVMNTEMGWPYYKIDADWGGASIQARYATKVYARGMAAGLLFVNWYSLIDSDPSLPGLVGGNYPYFDRRPVYFAVQRAIATLKSPTQYVRALTYTDLSSYHLEGYTFSVPKGSAAKRLDLVWYDCPSLVVPEGTLPADCTSTATYRIPATRVGVMDHLTGTMVIHTDGDDGQVDGSVSLTIDTNPVYIIYNP